MEMKYSLKCQFPTCGRVFMASRKHARLCPECTRKGRWTSLARHLASIGNHAKRCLYCGKKILGNLDFCDHCRMEGYDELYSVTHRSNGWDARPMEKVTPCGGWRGRKTMGGFSN